MTERDMPPVKWPEIVDACRGNHNAPDDPDRVMDLIKAGHYVNMRDDQGKPALHRASQAGFLKISQLLIDHGADLEAQSIEGETPLFDAAFHGRCKQVKRLIALGASIEARNKRGETPLFAEVRGGQATCFKTLVASGADILAENHQGKCIADVANRSRKKGIEEVRSAMSVSLPLKCSGRRPGRPSSIGQLQQFSYHRSTILGRATPSCIERTKSRFTSANSTTREFADSESQIRMNQCISSMY
jgi:hypothetical protein